MYALSGYIKIKEIITRLLTALYRKAFILSPVYRVFFSDFRFFRKGNFCPVCLKIYGSDDELQSPMICCDICDRWIHTGMLDLKFYSRYTQNDLFHIKSVQDIGFGMKPFLKFSFLFPRSEQILQSTDFAGIFSPIF